MHPRTALSRFCCIAFIQVALGVPSTVAISIRHDRSVADYNELALQSEYAAAGFLADSFGQVCTGALVSPTQVLTASHCVDDNADGLVDTEVDLTDLEFGFDANIPTEAAPNIATAAINPAWVTSNGEPDFDVAVLTLSQPITNVTPAHITDQDPQALIGTMVGYGEQGLGNGFPTNLPGANQRLAANNRIDSSGGVLQSDFDSPSGNTSTLGLTTPLNLEGSTGPGDSGGPLFADFDGVALIVGTLNGGINAVPGGEDSEYGDVSDWAALRNSQNLGFLANFNILPFSPRSSDFDMDSDVDGHDFLSWQRGETSNPLDAAELASWQADYGQPSTLFATSSVAVPEPHTLVLLTFCALSAARIRLAA